MSSLFRRNRVKPVWQYESNALIWRLLCFSKKRIIGESRSQESKKATFFCLDSDTGHILWNNVELEEPWWIGIETIHKQLVILHGYTRPDMPEHKGIHILDMGTGKELWNNKDLTYWFAQDDYVYAFKYLFEKRIGYQLDGRTGTIVQEYKENLVILNNLRKSNIDNTSDEMEDILYPELIAEEQLHSTIAPPLKQIIHKNILSGWSEYMVYKDILTLSYYYTDGSSPQGQSVNCSLLLYDLSRKDLLYEDVLGRGLAVSAPNVLFKKNDLMCYVKNQKILVALRPWK